MCGIVYLKETIADNSTRFQTVKKLFSDGNLKEAFYENFSFIHTIRGPQEMVCNPMLHTLRQPENCIDKR